MQRLVQRQRLTRQQINRFLPLDVDGTARFDNGEFLLNGDFFALSSVADQSAEVVTTGAFNFISDRDGNFSGHFNGRTALEVQLAADTVLGYFLGIEAGRARLSGTFAGRQDSYGVNAGGYMLRSFNNVSYITGFAALGRNKKAIGREQWHPTGRQSFRQHNASGWRERHGGVPDGKSRNLARTVLQLCKIAGQHTGCGGAGLWVDRQ